MGGGGETRLLYWRKMSGNVGIFKFREAQNVMEVLEHPTIVKLICKLLVLQRRNERQKLENEALGLHKITSVVLTRMK